MLCDLSSIHPRRILENVGIHGGILWGMMFFRQSRVDGKSGGKIMPQQSDQ